MSIHSSTHTRTLIAHTGALGDHILIWPLLRALLAAGHRVTLACESSKAALARAELSTPANSLHTLPIESELFRSLWIADTGAPPLLDRPAPTSQHFDLVLTFLTDACDAIGRAWTINAQHAFQPREIVHIGAPSSPSHSAAWDRWNVRDLGRTAPHRNPTGPVILHTGAGSRDKMWPIDRWSVLAALLKSRGRETRLIAGEVERERFTPDERAAFAAFNGIFIDTLDALAATLKPAALFIGADTGPTHLAAQLGLPALALFGPTNPATWSPVGPQVHVLAPPVPGDMTWLTPGHVHTHALDLLSSNQAGASADSSRLPPSHLPFPTS